MKKYSKKKSNAAFGPNASGPKYRKSSQFQTRKSLFGKNAPKSSAQVKHNPSTFKVQHKG